MRAHEPSRVIPALRDAIAAVDPELIERGAQGASRLSLVDAIVDGALAPRKLSMTLIGAFAACAMLLAAIGMYGVVAYGVAQRTREIGVRKALGATDGGIASLLFRESLVLVGIGVVVGCAGAFAGARLIQNQLFETTPLDATTYASAISILVATALIATWIPARRATRLDPTIAMRGD